MLRPQNLPSPQRLEKKSYFCTVKQNNNKMYYIKCSQCGHLNEVKSEYQVFCSGCNKKLDNNFADWKKRNPGKSFDDYQQLVCVSDEEIQKGVSDFDYTEAPYSKGDRFN